MMENIDELCVGDGPPSPVSSVHCFLSENRLRAAQELIELQISLCENLSELEEELERGTLKEGEIIERQQSLWNSFCKGFVEKWRQVVQYSIHTLQSYTLTQLDINPVHNNHHEQSLVPYTDSNCLLSDDDEMSVDIPTFHDDISICSSTSLSLSINSSTHHLPLLHPPSNRSTSVDTVSSADLPLYHRSVSVESNTSTEGHSGTGARLDLSSFQFDFPPLHDLSNSPLLQQSSSSASPDILQHIGSALRSCVEKLILFQSQKMKKTVESTGTDSSSSSTSKSLSPQSELSFRLSDLNDRLMDLFSYIHQVLMNTPIIHYPLQFIKSVRQTVSLLFGGNQSSDFLNKLTGINECLASVVRLLVSSSPPPPMVC